MKKNIFINSILVVVLLFLIGCGGEELTLQEKVSINASFNTSKELILDASSEITINNLDGEFFIFSEPEVIGTSKSISKDIPNQEGKKGKILTTLNGTSIPYPDEEGNSVFYGTDLNIGSDQIVKVKARKIKKIHNPSDSVYVDKKPEEGKNFCTKKTNDYELFEGIVEINLTGLSEDEKKNMIISIISGGVGTTDETKHSSDYGIINPDTWEQRGTEGYRSLDLSKDVIGTDTLFVYVSFSYQSRDKDHTLANWHKNINDNKLSLPYCSATVYPLKALTVNGNPISCSKNGAFYIDTDSETGFDSTKSYCLEFSSTDGSNIHINKINDLKNSTNPRYTDTGHSFPRFVPYNTNHNDQKKYIYLGEIDDDIFFDNNYVVGDKIQVALKECSHLEVLPDLGKQIEIKPGFTSFIIYGESLVSDEVTRYKISFKASEELKELITTKDFIYPQFKIKEKDDPYMYGTIGCSNTSDDSSRIMTIEAGRYPTTLTVFNTSDDYTVNITIEEIDL